MKTAENVAPAAPKPAAEALYPNWYTWYIFLSALDLMFTYLILNPIFSSPGAAIDPTHPFGPLEQRGREVNVLADWVFGCAGIPGLIVYKFALVSLVILICEIIGRRRFKTGLRVIQWAVILSCVPVAVALYQMIRDLAS